MEKKKRPGATGTTQIENDQTIVTEWRFPPGAETGWHRHEHDYTVVPMSTGTLTIEAAADSVSQSKLVAGQAYFRSAGVEHNVVNANDYEFVFVEIEYK